MLAQIDNLDKRIERSNKQIEVYGRPYEEAVTLLDTIPKVGSETSEIIVSEIETLHLNQYNEPYRELGGNHFDNRRPEDTAKRLVNRLV